MHFTAKRNFSRFEGPCNNCRSSLVTVIVCVSFWFPFLKKKFALVIFSGIFFFFNFLRLLQFLKDEDTPAKSLEDFFDETKPLEYKRSSNCVYVVARVTMNRFIKESERNPGILSLFLSVLVRIMVVYYAFEERFIQQICTVGLESFAFSQANSTYA